MTDKMEQHYVGLIRAKMEYLNSRLNYIQKPQNIEQITKHCNAIFLIIDQLRDIIDACPSINLEPKPDELLSVMEKTKNIKVTDFAISNADLNIEKAKAISSDRKRAKLIDEAKMIVIDAKNIFSDQEMLNKLETKLMKLKSL